MKYWFLQFSFIRYRKHVPCPAVDWLNKTTNFKVVFCLLFLFFSSHNAWSGFFFLPFLSFTYMLQFQISYVYGLLYWLVGIPLTLYVFCAFALALWLLLFVCFLLFSFVCFVLSILLLLFKCLFVFFQIARHVSDICKWGDREDHYDNNL